MSGGATVSLAQKYGLPPFSEDQDFESWCHEIDMWSFVTEVKKEKQACTVYLSLPKKVRLACKSLTQEEMSQDDGMKKLTDKLRELYAVEKDQAMFNAYEKFETFKRTGEMSIKDFINEFERLHRELESYKIAISSPVLAYQLLKNSGLPKAMRDLARATLTELTYDSMKKQLKAISDKCTATTSEGDSDILVEEESFYTSGRYNHYQQQRGSGSSRGGRGGRRGGGHGGGRDGSRGRGGTPGTQHNDSVQLNSFGPDGRRRKCFKCGSIEHFVNTCSYSSHKGRGDCCGGGPGGGRGVHCVE